MSPTRLSPHFTLEEFAVSAAHPALVVPVPVRYQPQLRCHVDTNLEPLRVAFGAPIRVLSGYRNTALNRAAGGSATSQHLYAQAADLTPANGRAALALFEILRGRALAGHALPHGQAIWYPDRNFIHLALPSDRYPRPTFCLHYPRLGLEYRVVDPDEDLDALLRRTRLTPS
jgi:hypothetical protein